MKRAINVVYAIPMYTVYPISGQTQIMLKSTPPTLPLKGGEYGKLRPYILPHHVHIHIYMYIYIYIYIFIAISKSYSCH